MTSLNRAAEAVTRFGLAALVLCLPLEFTSVFLRQQLSRFVLLAIGVAFAYLLITGRRRLLLPRQASVYLLLAYIALSLISWLVTRAPGSANSLLDISLYPVAALLITNLALSEQDHRSAWLAFVVSALGVAVLGAFLYLTHLQIWTPNPAVASRMNITFGDPNITARFLTLGACVAVMLYASRVGRTWLTVAAVVACGLVLPVTFSRSGLILFIVSVLIAAAFALDGRRALAIGAAALVAFALSTTVNPDTRQRAEDAAFTAVSAVVHVNPQRSAGVHHQAAVVSDDNRKYLIAAGLKMAADHPILGVGFGGYQHAILTTYHRFVPAGLPANDTDTESHTSMVTVLAEQGVIGALLLLAFLVQLAREALAARARRDVWSLWVTVPAVVVIPIFLYSQFEGRFFQEPYLWLALGLLYSALTLQARQTQATLEGHEPASDTAAAA